MSEKLKVAVIGLGAMGLPIATNLARAGYPTQGWNRSAAPRERASKEGIATPENLNEIDARIVFVTLPDLPQLIEVLNNGLQDALKPGDYLVVMSTVSPVEIIKFAASMKERDIIVIDAPLSGGEVGAQEATLSIMVGTNEESFQFLQPIFAILGKTVVLLGDVGAGQLTKAANQSVVAINLAAIGEAVTLARRAGLDASKVLEIFAGGLANSAVLQLRRPKIEAMDFPAGGKSKFLLKDLYFALDAAKSDGTELPVTELVTKLYAQLIENGDGELDHSAIIREIERLSN